MLNVRASVAAAKSDAIADFVWAESAGDELWKRTVPNDLKRMCYRSGKPLLACHTYLADL